MIDFRSGAMQRARATAPPSSGFTLIELVAAIVIVGAIVAVALPVFRDLRYDARVASLDAVRSTIAANVTLARTAWLAQGGGATVQLNGQTVAVYAVETTIGGHRYPAGAPTGAGMYMLLGCGPGPTVPASTSACASLPGYLVRGGDTDYLGLWPSATSSSWSTANCALGYYPPYGYDPAFTLGPWPGFPDYKLHPYVEVWTLPSPDYEGGC